MKINKDELYQKLIVENLTHKEASEYFSCSVSSINRNARRYELPKKIQYNNLAGKKFGWWTVEELCLPSTHPLYWWCQCKCGFRKKVSVSNLRGGTSTKCKKCASLELRSKDSFPDYIWQIICQRAKNKKIENTLTKKYIEDLYIQQDKKCALSGVEIVFGPSTRYKIDTTASLDRIDSNLGYIIGNVQWVHKKVNMAKQKMSNENFISLCNLVSKFNRSKL